MDAQAASKASNLTERQAVNQDATQADNLARNCVIVVHGGAWAIPDSLAGKYLKPGPFQTP